MTAITLWNTATRARERLVPLDPGNVRMYVCGPTVYDRAHLGNARPVVVFDLLFRLLRHVYGADHVTYVRNITDVDDKINARARELGEAGDARPMNAIVRDLTDRTIAWYHADMDALGALRPSAEPRATEWIAAMVAMIAGLLSRGHAYVAAGHVLFAVRSHPGYGRLSGRSPDDMLAGARVEVAPYKRDPLDFVLWKPAAAAAEPGWASPWGRGRPGWHIECSAMAGALLGPAFDIHAGGIDLVFPHHENELAQSEAACPGAGFARLWLHNEMVLVEGRKMSKSLGNFFTVRDLLGRGVGGEVIRLVLMATHYRSPMDWTEERRREAETVLRRWRGLVAGIDPAPSPAPSVLAALADDLNAAGAIAALHALAAAGDGPGLLASGRLMGLFGPDPGGRAEAAPAGAGAGAGAGTSAAAARIEALLAARAAAREGRDFARADAIRAALLAAGVVVRDTPAGAAWEAGPDFDPARLEARE